MSFISEKKIYIYIYNFMHFERHCIIIFFPENLKKNLGLTSKFMLGGVTLITGIFLSSLFSLKVFKHTMSFLYHKEGYRWGIMIS